MKGSGEFKKLPSRSPFMGVAFSAIMTFLAGSTGCGSETNCRNVRPLQPRVEVELRDSGFRNKSRSLYPLLEKLCPSKTVGAARETREDPEKNGPVLSEIDREPRLKLERAGNGGDLENCIEYMENHYEMVYMVPSIINDMIVARRDEILRAVNATSDENVNVFVTFTVWSVHDSNYHGQFGSILEFDRVRARDGKNQLIDISDTMQIQPHFGISIPHAPDSSCTYTQRIEKLRYSHM